MAITGPVVATATTGPAVLYGGRDSTMRTGDAPEPRWSSLLVVDVAVKVVGRTRRVESV